MGFYLRATSHSLFSLSSIGGHSVPSVWDSLQPDGPALTHLQVLTLLSLLTLPHSPHLSSWTKHLCLLSHHPSACVEKTSTQVFLPVSGASWKPWHLIAKVLEVQLLTCTHWLSVFLWQHNLSYFPRNQGADFKITTGTKLVHTSMFSRELLRDGHLLPCLGTLAQNMTHGRSSVNRCWISVYHTWLQVPWSQDLYLNHLTLSQSFFL